MCISLRDNIALNLHIHHYEIGSIEAVCHDTADKGSRKNNRIGTFFIKETFYGILICKIEFIVSPSYKISITFFI